MPRVLRSPAPWPLESSGHHLSKCAQVLCQGRATSDGRHWPEGRGGRGGVRLWQKEDAVQTGPRAGHSLVMERCDWSLQGKGRG